MVDGGRGGGLRSLFVTGSADPVRDRSGTKHHRSCPAPSSHHPPQPRGWRPSNEQGPCRAETSRMLAERLLLDGAVGCARKQSLAAAKRSARGAVAGHVALGSRLRCPARRCRCRGVRAPLPSFWCPPLPAALHARLLQGFWLGGAGSQVSFLRLPCSFTTSTEHTPEITSFACRRAVPTETATTKRWGHSPVLHLGREHQKVGVVQHLTQVYGSCPT